MMDQPCILVVDDEAGLRRTLAGYLKHAGYQVREAATGYEALDFLRLESFDLVVLDLGMPGMHGTELLQAARPLCPHTAFVILTGQGTLDSAILAIRHGAFDYLLKPAPVQQIAAVVAAALAHEQQRRQSVDSPVALLERALAQLKSADRDPLAPQAPDRFLQGRQVTVDISKQLVVVRGQPVDLTATEYAILLYLLRHKDRVVSCRELVAHLQGHELDERDARVILRSQIHRLRTKIEVDPAQPQLIANVRGSGYIFAGG